MTEITMENMESQENIYIFFFPLPQRSLKIHKTMIYRYFLNAKYEALDFYTLLVQPTWALGHLPTSWLR